MTPIARSWGDFTAFYYGKEMDTDLLVRRLLEAPVEAKKGRGGIRLLGMGEKRLVCRQYLHGGLFRALTKDLFLSDRRCRREAEILAYLGRQGFPVAEAVCALSENRGLTKRLYLVTGLIEDSQDLLDYLNQSGPRQRLRTIKRFAQLLWRLEQAGIFHPDLHLNNVLVTPKKELLFLDFDKACRKAITEKDVESMLWRLARFADKMAKQGTFRAQQREKMLFLRTYERLSGHGIVAVMEKKSVRKGLLHKIGWAVESFLYGR